MARNQERDPYAPPPMHHDRSGAVLRIAIIALLLGGAVWGYTMFASQPQTPLVAETAQEQMADAGGTTAPETIPEATSESLPQASPAPAAPTPQPRRTAPATESAPAEPVPPPSTSSAPATPTPIPPVDVPSAG